MPLRSIDPRLNRLQIPEDLNTEFKQRELDQLETFEVFQQKKENALFTYVGPIHAPNLEVAFLFAKEQYSRRATCFGLWVIKTRDILVTPYVNDTESVFDFLDPKITLQEESQVQGYEIFSLKKRGKPHIYLGSVSATSPDKALNLAKESFKDQLPCVNIWVVPADKMLKSDLDDLAMWLTTSEKKYREPTDYKVQDKINAFKLEKSIPQ